MDFGDLSDRMKKGLNKGRESSAVDDKPYDHAESYRLRGKMLGVLIRDARMSASRTVDDCARLLQIDPSEVEAWEYGDSVPSLPQLELLAYYLGIPVSHFWGQETRSKIDQDSSAQNEYVALRNRMIGGLLRSAREGENLSIDELSDTTKIDAALLQQYEYGEIIIPMHHLTVVASAVNRNMSYFLESDSYIGELLQMRAEWQKFMDLDEDVREFAANRTNLGFIKIAMFFSDLPTPTLRKIAEGMLEITM